MSGAVVVAPVVVALVSAVLTLGIRSRPRAQRATSVAGGVAYAAAVGALAWRVVLAPGAPGIVAYQPGGWPAPFGITLVADALSAFMLSIAAVVGLCSVAFSTRFVDPANQRTYYHQLFHLLLLGVTGAFLTGDLFNLFVWFEVMLMVSYVFVSFYGNDRHTAAAMRYLALNVVGSAFMLLAVGGLYATVGTLNMADMARRLADPAAHGVEVAPLLGLSGMLFATFALKAGLVPFQFWVPSAYRAAPLPITAMFAGVTKKVGLYAIVRLYFTVFGGARVATDLPGVAGDTPLAVLAPVQTTMGVLSVLVGGVGAVSRDTMDGLLAYSSIGQVGFIALPVALAAATASATVRRLGILAGLIYAFHHALTKGLLFLSTAAIRDATGTVRLADLGGVGQRSTAFATAVFVGGLSLIGVPPLVGFFGKLLVFRAAVDRIVETSAAVSVLVLAALLLGAALTIVYTTRMWVGSFWGPPTPPVETGRLDGPQVAIVASLAALVLVVGVGFDPLYRFAGAAADAALDTGGYVDAVAPGGDAS